MFIIILIILILSFFLKIKTKNKKNIKEKFINDNLDIQVKEIGNGKKIIMIDNFLKDPKYHLEYIKQNLKKKVSQKNRNYYPGIRIKANHNFNREVHKCVANISHKYYNKKFTQYKVPDHSEGYSIVNFLNKDLKPGSILPHRDCQRLGDYKMSGFACVIYFCNTTREYNGTAFYEMKCPINKKIFQTDKKYEKEKKILENYDKNVEYCIDKEEHLFKKIYEIDAKINRIIIYPTSYFHQGIINSEYYNDEDNIKDDRYTYTGFIFCEKNKIDKNNIEEPD